MEGHHEHFDQKFSFKAREFQNCFLANDEFWRNLFIVRNFPEFPGIKNIKILHLLVLDGSAQQIPFPVISRSENGLIYIQCNASYRFLNELVDVAFFTSSGRSFHAFVTRLMKKFFRTFSN